MQPRQSRTGRVLIAIIAAVAAVTATHAQAGDASGYGKLLKDKDSVLVTVKFVLKVKMSGMMAGMGDQESENEITGVMIDPTGLVLVSNSQLGGFTSIIKRFMPMGGGVSATTTDMRVLIGDDTEGRDAELLARDTELDLAWVKIKEPGGATFVHVDFSRGAVPELGQRIVAVRRMGKYFSRTAVVVEGRIGGITTKPRDLYVPTGEIMGALGLPIYLPDGKPVGITIQQSPDAEDAGGNPMAMLANLSSMQDTMASLILPAAEVVRATGRALASVEEEE